MKYGAPAVVRLRPNSPTMRIDDRLANRQANTHPFLLGRDKGLEEAADNFRWQSWSRIRNNEFHVVVVHAHRLDREFTPRNTLHRLDAIADEVEEYLPHLNLVDENRRNRRIELFVKLDPRIGRANKAESYRLFDKMVQVLFGPSRLSLFDKFAQLTNDLAGTGGLISGLIDKIHSACHLRRAAGDHVAASRRDEICDSGQRLIQLMRERGCHLAHRRKSRNMKEFVLKLLGPSGGPFPFGQIVDDSNIDRLAFDRAFPHGKVHGKCRPIFAQAEHLSADTNDPLLSGPLIIVDIFVMFGLIRGRHQHRHIFSHDIFETVAEQAFASSIVDLNVRLPVYDDDPVDSGLDQSPE